ncbi:MAG: hypothetical protein JWL77_2790 [Chthonomonadaceae bacterium]|nr:hypothetical protein [Chthonomonadaceae bacterium]
MIRWKEGDRAQIVDRAATAADIKSQLFYNHYRNLTGTVLKLYGTGETAQAAIDIDLEMLPEEIATRHRETRDRMGENLPGAARRTAGAPREEPFRLRYVVLVSLPDIKRHSAARLPAKVG